MPDNPGRGTTFEAYFDGEVPAERVRSGTLFDNVHYDVYRRENAESVPSHYTVYVSFPESRGCEHALSPRVLPPVPVHGMLNFGPTTDRWVGWGTIDARDYNLYQSGDSFEADSRMDETMMFGNDTVSWWTPNRLARETEEWIIEAFAEVKQHRCRLCG